MDRAFGQRATMRFSDRSGRRIQAKLVFLGLYEVEKSQPDRILRHPVGRRGLARCAEPSSRWISDINASRYPIAAIALPQLRTFANAGATSRGRLFPQAEERSGSPDDHFAERTYCEHGTKSVHCSHFSNLGPGGGKTAVGWLSKLRNGAYTPPESSVIRSTKDGSVRPAFG